MVVSAVKISTIIPTVFVPRGKRFEPLLQDALAKGQITPELRAAMNDNTVRLAHCYEEVALVVITALMVLKPFQDLSGLASFQFAGTLAGK